MSDFAARIAPRVDRVCGQLYGPEMWKHLSEDVLQVSVGRLTLDVGWWPSYSRRGRYVVQAILDCNWDAPLAELETRDPAEVERFIMERIPNAEDAQ